MPSSDILTSVATPDTARSDATHSDATSSDATAPKRAHLNLFLVSFLILFFELACIRWFASSVIFLTFFTNLILMASFLGMSVGCMTASHKRNYILAFIPLTLLAVVLATSTVAFYDSFSRVTVDVGGQASPQQIYFGTEYRANDPSRIVIPIEAIAAVFFTLVAVIFVGLGQVMGRAFNAIPNRVLSYTTDIAGSLSGIICFSIASYLRTSPLVWFAISMTIAWYFLWPFLRHSTRRIATPLQLAALCGVLVIMAVSSQSTDSKVQTFWSPYYKVNYIKDGKSQEITTNNIGHQGMVSVEQGGPAYALPHLLNRDAGRPAFQDVLIIGAGSGNDVQAARSFGAGHIDAVEIDPVLNEIGRREHPNQPYSDPRVSIHLDDGRSFLKKTQKKYDLIIYALVDSLVLHSGYSSLRLESFLFTQEAFQDIKARLKPDGVFAMYNFYRQGWVVTRLAKMSEQVFGSKPLVASLPYLQTIAPGDAQQEHITFILSGSTGAIKQTLQQNQFFWLHQQPKFNRGVSAFGAQPPQVAGADPGLWRKIGPAQVETATTTLLPSDNWPFLYLRERAVPALNIRGMILVAVLSLAVLFLFAPARPLKINWQMFFLGAGFMLLETKGVVHMALLFGSTWIVNSIVFAAILVMILFSNLFVLKVQPRKTGLYYGLLAAALLVNIIVPMNVFLALPGAAKVILSCAVVFVPVFFAGIIFATTFRDSQNPSIDFGSNVGGVILGGLCEYFSLLIGFNHLIIIAMAFYFLSLALKPRVPLRLNAPGT